MRCCELGLGGWVGGKTLPFFFSFLTLWRASQSRTVLSPAQEASWVSLWGFHFN